MSNAGVLGNGKWDSENFTGSAAWFGCWKEAFGVDSGI